MEFETKKALLEHLGKNGNDRKLVDRMIIRGEVYMDNGMYVLREESLSDTVERLTNENLELQEEVKKLKSGKNATVECDTNVTEVNKLKEDLYVSETNAKYWEDLNKKKKKILNHILNDIYLDAQKRGSTENIEDFATRMSEKYGYNPKED